MSRALRWLPGLVGVLLVAVGATVFASAGGEVTDYSWSAYAPLAAESAYESRLELIFTGDSWQVLWTAQHVLGAALVVSGVLVLAAVGGYLVGRHGGPAGRAAAAGPA